jgi:hypothetical protein
MDLCAVGDEVDQLRKVVASQDSHIAEQEARIAKLERALEMILKERQGVP